MPRLSFKKHVGLHEGARKRLLLLAIAAFTGFADFASAGLTPPLDLVPVDRLVANLSAFVKEHPNDAAGFYALGRAHAMAYVNKSSLVGARVFETGEHARGAPGNPPVHVADRGDRHEMADGTQSVPDRAALLQHLAAAIRAFERAIEIGPADPRYSLSLAWVLEAGQRDALDCEMIPGLRQGVPKDLVDRERSLFERAAKGDKSAINHVPTYGWGRECGQGYSAGAIISVLVEKRKSAQPAEKELADALITRQWQECVLDYYFVAMSLALITESKATEKDHNHSLNSFVSHEAAKAYKRGVEAGGVRDKDRLRLDIAERVIKHQESLPNPRSISPIVLGLSESASIRSLLAPELDSTFDLDGTGRTQRWQWVRPDTGILCWDPDRTGKITSGRQLFGSVSWWVFFDNGYRALDALDDNRDGELAGAELSGLSVWFDRNSNGVSDAGEVVAVQMLGIAAISCRATSESEGCPANRAGLRLTDGRVLPTYDWIARSAEPESKSKPAFVPLAAATVFAPMLMFAAHRRRLHGPS